LSHDEQKQTFRILFDGINSTELPSSSYQMMNSEKQDDDNNNELRKKQKHVDKKKTKQNRTII
jgi:hypothetical protein